MKVSVLVPVPAALRTVTVAVRPTLADSADIFPLSVFIVCERVFTVCERLSISIANTCEKGKFAARIAIGDATREGDPTCDPERMFIICFFPSYVSYSERA